MSNFNARSSSFDRAIERAVRQMTQQEPRPGFRRRVLRRIERRSGSPWSIVRGAPLIRLAAFAAVAIVVLGAAVMMREPETIQPSPAVQIASTPSAAREAIPHAPSVAPVAEPPARPPAATARRRAEPTPEAIFGPRRGVVTAASVETLAGPAALPLPEWEPTIYVGAPIAITPIKISPIVVAPVTLTAFPER